MKLGCIADDFTGATDLANNLVRAGMRVVQTLEVPDAPLSADVDAVVVALKSRTIPADQAVAQSLAALKEKEAACAAFGEVTRKYPKASNGVKQSVDREQKRVGC